ncbi:MAG: translocation/assembly module TamB domain-containing protein, partial [Gemmatimonadota bacterium]|nr:translocation/assembly module TamB domain-containing protein [Gemmatimonadota bacterium]
MPDSLKGVKRDSALLWNIRRRDAEIRKEPTRLTRTWRFVQGTIALGRTRLADPDSAGMRFEFQKIDLIWVMPPFAFRNLKASVRRLGDTLWFDGTSFNLPNSSARGNAKVVWGNKLPVRYDIRLHGDTVAMSDFAWIDPALPWTGGGSVDFTLKNDPHDLTVMEYGLRNLDARSLNSHLRGNMTFGVGGPVLRVTDVALDMIPANTDLLRQFNGQPFPFDWQGNLTAHIDARGGPVNRFAVEHATFSYSDAHVPGAVSSGSAKGVLDIYKPALTVMRGVDLQLDRLDLRTPRYVNKLFPKIDGIVRGKMRLDSLWFDVRYSNADLEHADGPGDPSRFTGDGHITLLKEGVRFDVDMLAAPLSYTTLARSYPGLPLRGLAIGPIKARGMSENFEVSTTLAGDGGELNFVGQIDAFEPEYAAHGRFRTRGINLRTLLGDPSLPVTNLALHGATELDGATLADLKGRLTAEVDARSKFGEANLYAGGAQLLFDAGQLKVEQFKLESSAFGVNARGGLGLIAGKRDSLQFTLAVDSLSGLRQWFSANDTLPTILAAAGDTVRGALTVRGSLSGSIDTTDAFGLRLQAIANARGLEAAGAQASLVSLNFDVSDILRAAHGNALLAVDSAVAGGVHIASMTARAALRDGVAERFGMTLRTAADATLAIAGGMSRSANYSDALPEAREIFVLLDTVTLHVDTAQAARQRGFSLQSPAHLILGADNTAQLDSLVLTQSDTGTISLRGSVNAAGEVKGSLLFERIPLADVGVLLQTPSLQSGSISAMVSATGTRELPKFDGTLALRNATVGPIKLDRFDVAAKYDSQRLSVDGTLWAKDRKVLLANAELPLDLALVSGHAREIDKPLTGRLRTDSVSLSVLQSFLPDVASASGNLNTDISLNGTWAHPRLRGSLNVDNGSLSLSNLGIKLDRVRADLALAGDTLLVRQVSATSGMPGDSVSITGRVLFSDPKVPVFDLQLAASNFLAIDKPRSASLTVSTTRPVSLSGSTNAALVRGGVRIDRGRVYVRALTQKRAIDLADNMDVADTNVLHMNELLPDAPSALVQNLTLDNVLIEVGDDVWLRSPEANIKLGGALRVTRAVGRDGGVARLALSDSLTVQRGSYQLNLGLARPSFEVERGVIRFFGDPDLEPAIDISALHTVRETRANSNRQDVRIRVNIGGTLNQLSLGLSSADNPPLPESDMLSYLVTGEPANVLLGTRYSEQTATLALRLAGSYLSSRLAGGRFDVVQVEPTAIAPGEAANLRENGLGILAATRVGVGWQVTRNTYLSLSTGFCGLASQGTSSDLLSLFAQGLGVKA